MKYLVTEDQDVEMLAPPTPRPRVDLDVSLVACAAPGRGRRWSRRERAATVGSGKGAGRERARRASRHLPRVLTSATVPTPPHRCAWRGSRIRRAGPRSAPPQDTLDSLLALRSDSLRFPDTHSAHGPSRKAHAIFASRVGTDQAACEARVLAAPHARVWLGSSMG